MRGPPLGIVQLVESLERGGLERMVLHLAAAHRAAGHRSSIYTVFAPGSLAADARAAGVPVASFDKERGTGFSPEIVFRIARRLRSDGAEILHTHNAAIHHYGALAGTQAGAVVVNTRHGVGLHAPPMQDVYFRAVQPLTHAIVFVAESLRRHFTGCGIAPPAKSEVISNGIPVEVFQAFRARPGSANPRIRFGTMGRLVAAKAHGDLLDAFAIVARQLPAAGLSIWGYGVLREELENRIESLGLSDRVHYCGPAEKPAEVFQELDVFVLSSVSEGMPLVILEAMAAGLPIVSTRVGGVPEVVPAGRFLACRAPKPAQPRGSHAPGGFERLTLRRAYRV